MNKLNRFRFRAMILNGDWVHGLLSYSYGKPSQPPKGYYISNSVGQPWAYNVRPETVGQILGLPDKNGEEIYAGDIVREKLTDATYEIKFGSFHIKNAFGIGFWKNGISGNNSPIYIDEKLEIIGNIHEHKQLLK